MGIRLFHLNIFQGKNLDKIIDFVRKSDIDILHFQEVSKGKMSGGGKYRYPRNVNPEKMAVNSKNVGIDCFEEVKEALNINGRTLYTYGLKGDENSAMGNATFYSDKFKVISEEVVWLKDYTEIEEGFTDIPKLGRGALITEFELNGTSFTTVNTHFAWGPNPEDEQYKINQAKKLLARMEKMSPPFILTGDFNVSQQTETAGMFNKIGRNLTKENNITNTLNPVLHPAKILFPPGLAVDYMFTSEGVKVNSLEVVDEGLSDHLGLLLDFELS